MVTANISSECGGGGVDEHKEPKSCLNAVLNAMESDLLFLAGNINGVGVVTVADIKQLFAMRRSERMSNESARHPWPWWKQ